MAAERHAALRLLRRAVASTAATMRTSRPLKTAPRAAATTSRASSSRWCAAPSAAMDRNGICRNEDSGEFADPSCCADQCFAARRRGCGRCLQRYARAPRVVGFAQALVLEPRASGIGPWGRAPLVCVGASFASRRDANLRGHSGGASWRCCERRRCRGGVCPSRAARPHAGLLPSRTVFELHAADGGLVLTARAAIESSVARTLWERPPTIALRPVVMKTPRVLATPVASTTSLCSPKSPVPLYSTPIRGPPGPIVST